MNYEKQIMGKSVAQLQVDYPIIKRLAELEETTWINSGRLPSEKAVAQCPLTMADVQDASDRLDRFADYFKVAFPETQATDGILESPLQQIPHMQACLNTEFDCEIPGKVWIKLDSHLPISGSIKARGGIYEVLYVAEKIALERGLLKAGDSYEVFHSQKFRDVFSQYSIAVGSTGNLGLSIGIMSAKLGFNVTVHMSADARQWKKDMLRSKGVTVVEYESDYSIAVAQGRQQAANDPFCHFVDDENSKTLFMGYSVAALRLKEQFKTSGLTVDARHPLFVYLPCGVGGGPGGVAFGIKQIFGDNVHCFFAEPTHSCCMLLGMATGLNSAISVQDIGVDNRTVADGLAVGRASGFVGGVMAPFISGCYSIEDWRMYRMLAQLADTEGLKLEPSALAGMYGPVLMTTDSQFAAYPASAGISRETMEQAIHLVWATGGSMVPPEEMQHYYETGKNS
ncbi:MAG: D-serine ammonia-lyase [Clostridia bacterium]|nr:D-serine ammonia-lyase [Clostridia bacterium]